MLCYAQSYLGKCHSDECLLAVFKVSARMRSVIRHFGYHHYVEYHYAECHYVE
jgi:hypothetical protein